MRVYLCLIIVINCGNLFSQTLLNGDFENTSGNCDYNLSNSEFNLLMDDCYASGVGNHPDILDSSCNYGPAQNGNHFIGIDGYIDSLNDEHFVLLRLSTPLIPGENYFLQFYHRTEQSTSFEGTRLEIGCSIDTSNFGNILDTTSIPTTSWGVREINFTPLISAEYITVRSLFGNYGWNLLDNFILVSGSSGLIKNDLNENAFSISPNPSSEKIKIETEHESLVEEIRIYDSYGESVMLSHNLNIDISGLESGVYMVSVLTKNGLITKKLVKY